MSWLIEMDSQFLLILSACSLRDQLEDEKIRLVSNHVDRLFTLFQLQRSYDSNDFNEAIYKISNQIREKAPAEIEAVFEASLLAMISVMRGTPTTESVSYTLFKDTGYELNKRFKRYFFARIEEFIAAGTKMNMKHSITDLVQKTGSVSGFHIEHILADNAENLQAFGNDRDRFDRECNRLGGHQLKFRPMNTFGAVELEERHKLLFDMIKEIWR